MIRFLSTTALMAVLATPVFAQETPPPQCPPGVQSCNITEIGDRDTDASQTVGDTVNPVYAPDSATASASTGAIDVDSVAQGGAAYATGNSSTNTNENNSSANNTGSVYGSADVSGGNISSSGGNITSSASTVSGPATTTSGPATTNSGSIATNATGGAGGAGGQGGAGGYATSSSGGNQMAQQQGQTTSIDASQRTTIRHSAATAAGIALGGYGAGNCFGDTNPSGQFGASIQTFGWGVTANASKASNVCALMAIAGPQAAMAYLGQMDNNVRAVLLNNGLAITRAEADAARARANTVAIQQQKSGSAGLVCPAGSAWDGIGCKRGYKGAPAPVANHNGPILDGKPAVCPPGSSWNGKGCWMPKRK